MFYRFIVMHLHLRYVAFYALGMITSKKLDTLKPYGRNFLPPVRRAQAS